MNEATVVSELGEDGIRSLVSSFYRRVKVDNLMAPMYPNDDWDGAEDRLAKFLLFRLGVSQAYMEERGHPRLRMRHMPFAIGEAERDRWLKLMGEAMDEVETPAGSRQFLEPFFAQTADFMRNRAE